MRIPVNIFNHTLSSIAKDKPYVIPDSQHQLNCFISKHNKFNLSQSHPGEGIDPSDQPLCITLMHWVEL